MNDPFDGPERPKAPLGIRIAKAVWAIARGYFISIGVVVTLLSLSLTLMLMSEDPESLMGESAPSVEFSKERPAVLELRIDAPILDRSASDTEVLLQRLFDEKPGLYLHTLRGALSRAKDDPRITRLDIDLNLLQGSIAEIAELRRILEDFRSGGKSIHMALNDLGTWHYYLASAADTITLNPTAGATLTGPVFQLVYFGEALRKIGVDIEVVRFGKYKSAFEPFIQNDPSPATIEQYESMEESIREHLVEVIAKGRGRDVNEVRSWFTQSLFTAKDALDRGIIDAIGYGPEAAGIANIINAADPVKLRTYSKVIKTEDPVKEVADEKEGGIALIEAAGEIVMDSPAADPDVIAPEPIIKELRWAAKKEAVKAVVLRINSPGGSATASDMIWYEVDKLREKKPVVVSMGGVAASGGYYIAAPATKIIAEPTTITGSIGVIGMLPNFGPFEEKYGVSFHAVSQSERKNLFNPGEKSTAFDKALVQSGIDAVYEEFVGKVAQGRKIPVEEVKELAQGRVYTGIEAVGVGLVDELGGLWEALQQAKALAGFDTEKLYRVLRYEPETLSLSHCLRNPTDCFGGTRSGWLGLALDPAKRMAQVQKTWRRWFDLDPKRPLALWPGYLSLQIN